MASTCSSFDSPNPLGPHGLDTDLTQAGESAHVHWMRAALVQAQRAAQAQEVPVGAVVVKDGRIIAQAHNQTLQLQDPCAHAEMLALRAAAAALGNHRLDGCTLYVTLEPCCMCTGAIFQARLAHVVFGAAEPKTGMAGSVLNLYDMGQLNHHTRLTKGVLAQECAGALQDFFGQRRKAQKTQQTLNSLRDDALRSPASRFEPFTLPPTVGRSVYEQALPRLQGLRMHGLANAHAWPQTLPRTPSVLAQDAATPTQGQGEPQETDLSATGLAPGSKPTFVCLAPVWHWSIYWGAFMAQCTEQGAVCYAPDLPGWGPSDKPKKTQWHSLSQHADILAQWLEPLRHAPVVLLAHNWQLPLVLALRLQMGDHAAHWRIIGVNVDPWLQTYLTRLPCDTLADTGRCSASGAPGLAPNQAASRAAPAQGPHLTEPLPAGGLPKSTLQWLKGLPSLRGDLCWSEQLAKNARALSERRLTAWDAAQLGAMLSPAPAPQTQAGAIGQIGAAANAQASALPVNAPYPDAGHAAGVKAILAARFAPFSDNSTSADKALWAQAMALGPSLVACQALQFLAYESLSQCLQAGRI